MTEPAGIAAIAALAGVSFAGNGPAADDDTYFQAARARLLLLDSRIVEETEDAELTLGKTFKSEHNPLMGEDKPWEKPELGLVEYEGSKWNNILWRGPHGTGLFKDHRDPDPARRYKAFFQGVSVAFSADGIHWGKAISWPQIKVRGDTVTATLLPRKTETMNWRMTFSK